MFIRCIESDGSSYGLGQMVGGAERSDWVARVCRARTFARLGPIRKVRI